MNVGSIEARVTADVTDLRQGLREARSELQATGQTAEGMAASLGEVTSSGTALANSQDALSGTIAETAARMKAAEAGAGSASSAYRTLNASTQALQSSNMAASGSLAALGLGMGRTVSASQQAKQNFDSTSQASIGLSGSLNTNSEAFQRLGESADSATSRVRAFEAAQRQAASQSSRDTTGALGLGLKAPQTRRDDDAKISAAKAALDAEAEAAKRAEAALQAHNERLRDIGTLSSSLTSIGGTLTLGLTAPIIGLGVATTNAATDMESLKRGLVAITGSSAEAEAQLIRLQSIAKMPGLSFREAVEGSTRLQATGMSAQMAERTLKAFGNALASVGKGAPELNGVILALGQIQSKGKVSAEEINQIAERLPQIRKAMQEAFGTADTEALQKMGLTTDEFISKVVQSLEKIPPVARGTRESIEDLKDQLFRSGAEIGASLTPAVRMISDTAIPVIKGLTGAFVALPAPVKAGVLAIGGILAVVGPATYALGTFTRSVKEVHEGWTALVKLGPSIISLFTGKAVAVGADTGALALNTAAEATNATTTGTNTAAKATNTTTVGANTVAVGANTTALAANTAAAGAGGFLGTGMGAVPVVGAAAATAAIGYTATENFITKPFIIPALQNKFDRDDEDINRRAMEIQQRNLATRQNKPLFERRAMKEIRDRIMREQNLSQEAAEAQILRNRESAEANQFNAPTRAAQAKVDTFERKQQLTKSLSNADTEDAQYEAFLQRARTAAAGGKEGSQAREAKSLVPILQQRITQLTARAETLLELSKTDQSKQEDYWKVVKETDQVREKIIDLQQDAIKEEADAAKKAATKKKQQRTQQRELDRQAYQNRLLALRAMAAEDSEGGEPVEAPIYEAQIKVPALENMQRDVLEQMREMLNSTDRSPEAQKEYGTLVSEYWNLQLEKSRAIQSAARAEETIRKRAEAEAKKAVEQQRKLYNAYWKFQEEQAKARVDEADDNQKAAAMARELIPVIDARQEGIMADLQNTQAGSLEYFQKLAEYWQEEREAQTLMRNARKEAEQQQKKAANDLRQAHEEQMRIEDATLKLQEARIKNDPFTNAYQKQGQIIQLQFQKLRQLSRTNIGETRLERLQRETAIEETAGELFQNATQFMGANMRLRTNRRFNPLQGAFNNRRMMMRLVQQIQGTIAAGRNDPIPDLLSKEDLQDRVSGDWVPFEQRPEYQNAQQAGQRAAGATGTVIVNQFVIDPNVSRVENERRLWGDIQRMLDQVEGPRATGTR